MELSINHLDPVFTADDTELGVAVALFHRLNEAEINPQLKLYASYLEVSNENLGDVFYIPTEFIDHTEGNQVRLSIPMKTVQHETMTRKPDFIAFGKAQKEMLPE